MRVLLVCTANIVRSPLAAAMLASACDTAGIEVASAGVRARPGLPAAEYTQELALRRGLDLSDHRSHPLEAAHIAASALVLTMTEYQRDYCAPLAHGAGTYTFALRELVRLLAVVDLGGGPSEPQPRADWLVERAHLARPRASRPYLAEDVIDPVRAPWPAWVEMAATLDDLLGHLVHALGLTPNWHPPLTPSGPPADAGLTAPEARTTARRWPPRWLRRLNA